MAIKGYITRLKNQGKSDLEILSKLYKKKPFTQWEGVCIADYLKSLNDTGKIYKIEYGRSVYYKSAKKGRDFHTTKPLTKKQAQTMLKKLNKKFEYTTLFKLKNGKWDAIG